MNDYMYEYEEGKGRRGEGWSTAGARERGTEEEMEVMKSNMRKRMG